MCDYLLRLFDLHHWRVTHQNQFAALKLFQVYSLKPIEILNDSSNSCKYVLIIATFITLLKYLFYICLVT